MANNDNPRGFWPASPITPISVLLKTNETVAVGDAVFPDGANGMTIALADSDVIWNGGVVAPQENASGTFISQQGANVFTTSSAGQMVEIYPFLDPATLTPNRFRGQVSGSSSTGMLRNLYDIVGGTGAMEVDQGGTVAEYVVMVTDIYDGDLVNHDSSGRVVANEVGAAGVVEFIVPPLRAA